jgi:hypothetical protein
VILPENLEVGCEHGDGIGWRILREQRKKPCTAEYIAWLMEKVDINLERAGHDDLASNGIKYSITNWT